MAKTASNLWVPPTASFCFPGAKTPVVMEGTETAQDNGEGDMDSLFFVFTPDGAVPVRWANVPSTETIGDGFTEVTPIDGVSLAKVKVEKTITGTSEADYPAKYGTRPASQIAGPSAAKNGCASGAGGGSDASGASIEGFESSGEEVLGSTPRQKKTRRESWPSYTSSIEKEKQRKERNRKAQQKFRERQRSRIAHLEQEAKTFREKIRQLEIHNSELNRENEVMKSYMGFFGGPPMKASQENFAS